MNTSFTTVIASACLLAAVLSGLWARRFLLEHHLTKDSKDTVKLALGLVATMSALLLGLLVNSAKTSYDTTRTQVMQKAAKYALLDRILAIYGPQAAQVRGELPALIEESMRRTWPDGADIQKQSMHVTEMGNSFYVGLLRLEAHDDAERTLKSQAVSLTVELGQINSLMQAESTTSISTPMLVVLVIWLVIIFFGFSLYAPKKNATAALALIASALCVAGSLLLILELDRPFDGILQISSEPMWNVLRQCGK